MGLCSDALMVLFYDIAGDTTDHDDWQSYEHFHERLSAPGFIRATRWLSTDKAPRYFITYEVTDVEVATSTAYLDRLNNPTPWTTELMGRFRGMTRGFCNVTASAGCGLGNVAAVMRFTPKEGSNSELTAQPFKKVLPAMASRRGMVGAHLLQPAPPPPMTREQSLRGPDKPLPWLVFATAYNVEASRAAMAEHLDTEFTGKFSVPGEVSVGTYMLHHSVSSCEVARTVPPAVFGPKMRAHEGPRLK